MVMNFKERIYAFDTSILFGCTYSDHHFIDYSFVSDGGVNDAGLTTHQENVGSGFSTKAGDKK